MHKRNWALLAGLTILATGLLAVALAQDSPTGTISSPDDMAKMIEKWKNVINPGEHHKALEQRIGSWDTVTRMWMGGPGAQAVETKGSSEFRWVLGGRFIMEEHKGKTLMPDDEGRTKSMDYEGIGLTGYDNYKNQYVATWIDSLGTQMLSMRGGRPPEGKKFFLYGLMDEPMLDIHDRMVKYVLEIVDENKHTFTLYDLHAGDDYKVVEISYTRKSK